MSNTLRTCSFALMFLIFLVASNLKSVEPPEITELFPVQIEGRWGFINSKGEIILPPNELFHHTQFSEGRATFVAKNGLSGYINEKGKVVIKPQYHWANGFKQGLAAVQLGGHASGCNFTYPKTAFIDNAGAIIIPPQEYLAYHFSEDLALIDVGGKYSAKSRILNHDCDENSQAGPQIVSYRPGLYGFIDKTGKVVIEPKYKEALFFSHGLAPVMIDNKWGYINKKGILVIRAEFDTASWFQEGLAIVKQNGKYGYIDTKGKIVLPCSFADASEFREGLAKVGLCQTATSHRSECLMGYIDKRGKIVIPAKYAYAEDFHEGLAAVSTSSRMIWGFIDKTGKMIIPERFSGTYGFSNGLAAVFTGGYYFQGKGKMGYINKKGEYVWKPSR